MFFLIRWYLAVVQPLALLRMTLFPCQSETGARKRRIGGALYY